MLVDCLVSQAGVTLAALPEGAVVGTSSLRREAQLRALRPDLEIRSIRGNVDTRVGKVRAGEYDAAVLAAAGLRRLGLESEVAEWLAPEVMLPAPGQARSRSSVEQVTSEWSSFSLRSTTRCHGRPRAPSEPFSVPSVGAAPHLSPRSRRSPRAR